MTLHLWKQSLPLLELMRDFDYQRQVIAYHGCDASVQKSVLLNGKSLKGSANDYDWLGHGIYFWEHGPRRALDWAREQVRHGRISKPTVLGAVLHLGRCFDLLDAEYTEVLVEAWPIFKKSYESDGMKVPDNKAAKRGDDDLILRQRDCAVLNWVIGRIEKAQSTKFQSVRGVFQEGAPVYEGSGIKRRSHIQIAIRDPACILGYFRPAS